MMGVRSVALGLAWAASCAALSGVPPLDESPTITPVTVEGRQSFVDSSGELIVGVTFEPCSAIREGWRITFEGGTGYLDATGTVVTKLPDPDAGSEVVVFSEVVDSSGGMNRVSPLKGFMDHSGRVVLKPQFDSVYGFSGGIWRVVNKQNGSERWGFVDAQGRLLVAPRFKRAYPFSEGVSNVTLDDDTRVFVDPTGRVVSDSRNRYMDSWFSEGLAPAQRDGKWGYVDKTWSFVVPPRFDRVSQHFSDGLAGVWLRGASGMRKGFINRKGEMVIEPRDWTVMDFSDGRAAVKWPDLDGWGYIDRSGREVVSPQFVDAFAFRGGVAAVSTSLTSRSISAGCWNGLDIINRHGEYVWRNPLGDPYRKANPSPKPER